MQQFYEFITRRLYVAQRVSGVSPPIIGSIQLHWEPLVLLLAGSGWSVVGRGLAVLPLAGSGWSVVGRGLARPRTTTLQPLPANGRTRNSQCSCMLLMIGGEMPETCWATCERRTCKTVASCWLIYMTRIMMHGLANVKFTQSTERSLEDVGKWQTLGLPFLITAVFPSSSFKVCADKPQAQEMTWSSHRTLFFKASV